MDKKFKVNSYAWRRGEHRITVWTQDSETQVKHGFWKPEASYTGTPERAYQYKDSVIRHFKAAGYIREH